MKFCTKCGHKLSSEDISCPNCGKSLTSPKDKLKTSISICKMNKKNVKILITSLSLIVILITGFLGLNFYFDDPYRVANNFKVAAANNDVSTLSSIIYCEDPRIKVDENTIKPLATYLKENPSYLNELLNHINEDAKNLKDSEDSFAPSSNNILTLKKYGHNFIFFPKYSIAIQPCFIDLSLKVKDAKVLLDNKEICTSNKDDFSKEIGPILPGKYKLVASYKNKYINITENNDIDLITNLDKNKISVDMLNNIKYIDVDSDSPNSILYVNNKNTGIPVSKAKHFGPLTEDTKLFSVEKFSDGTFKSEEITVGSNSNPYLSLQQSKTAYSSFADDLSNLISEFNYNFTLAVNNNTFSYIENYLYPNSKLYNMQKKTILDINKAGFTEEHISTTLVSYNFDDKTKEGTLVAHETYDITNKNNETKTKDFTNTYKFKYNPAKNSYQLTEMIEK